jgi:putative membrane protein
LFAFHPVNERALLVYALVVFVCGFLIEWVGVETGRIFGSYFYGNNLGIKLFDVPLIIGINWLLLSYCSSVIASNIIGNKNAVLLSAIGALLMVLVDFFIEQRAPDFDFWYWQNNVVPLQNYTAWFAFAFAFNFLFFKLHINNKNPIAPVLYLLQLLFFVALFFLQ